MSNPGSPSKTSPENPNHEHKGYEIVSGMKIEKLEDPWDMSDRDPSQDMLDVLYFKNPKNFVERNMNKFVLRMTPEEYWPEDWQKEI
jgi:hypothetical protein